MAVEVETSRAKHGGGFVTENHDDANDILISDGHLFVRRHQDTVAIYAPGMWRSGKVVKAQ